MLILYSVRRRSIENGWFRHLMCCTGFSGEPPWHHTLQNLFFFLHLQFLQSPELHEQYISIGGLLRTSLASVCRYSYISMYLVLKYSGQWSSFAMPGHKPFSKYVYLDTDVICAEMQSPKIVWQSASVASRVRVNGSHCPMLPRASNNICISQIVCHIHGSDWFLNWSSFITNWTAVSGYCIPVVVNGKPT